MPRKNSFLTVTDQFCGAGGSSQGVRNLAGKYSGGLHIKLALNHWALAIETHNTNFPDTLHDCTDISASDPRRYPSTDILITSPECTNHSLAKGKKILKKQMDLFAAGKLDAAAERSRATMWDVPRFAEYHGYNIIVTENVVDAREWVLFDSWLTAMYALGYKHKCVYHNSMHHHPTPQSRDRMYVVFWKKGNKAPDLDFFPPSWCPRCEKQVGAVQTWKRADKHYGKYRTQYVYCCPTCTVVVTPYYYAAFNCIDWSDRGERIGDRERPLSPKTIARCKIGVKKYGQHPFQVVNYSPGYCKDARDSFATITKCDHHGIFTPFIIKLEHDFKLSSAGEPLKTQTTRQSDMVISGRPITDALPTQTTCQGMSIVVPILTECRGTSTARPATEPIGTVTAGGIHHGILTTESWNSFLAAYNGGSTCLKHITEEMGTLPTRERMAVMNFKTPGIDDCYYRMLKPPEIKRGMAFDDDYIILGSGRDQVKQCGNAVTPPAMQWLIDRCVQSLA